MKLFIFFTFLTISLFAQEITPLKRIELPLKSNENYVLPLANQHVLVLSNMSKKTMAVICLDKDLNEKWKSDMVFPQAIEYQNFWFDGKEVYLLFLSTKQNHIFITKLNTHTKEHETKEFVTPPNFDINDFETFQKVLLVGGNLKTEPAILRIDWNSEKITILSNNLKGDIELQSVDIDTLNRQFRVGLSQHIKGIFQFNFLIFDWEGNPKSQLLVEPDDNLAVFNGRMSPLTDNAFILGGYGFRNSQTRDKQSVTQGLYVCKVLPNEILPNQYYSFTEFKNFFSYLDIKEQQRIERRIQVKKEKGKKYEINHQILVHNITERKDDYVVVLEAYTPEFRVNQSPWDTYSYPYSAANSLYRQSLYRYYPSLWGWGTWNSMGNRWGNSSFDGWKYSHAVVVVFDKNGKLLWDNVLEFPKNYKSYQLRQMVRSYIDENSVTLSYSFKGKLYKKIFKDGKQLPKFNFTEDNELEDKKLKNTEDEGTDFWYNNYSVSYGRQKVITPEESKKVFFVHKIEL